MGYPAAYRSGAYSYNPGRRFQPSTDRRPIRSPLSRVPLRPVASTGVALGARFAARLIPWVSVGLALWDLYDLWKWYNNRSFAHDGFTMTWGPCTVPGSQGPINVWGHNFTTPCAILGRQFVNRPIPADALWYDGFWDPGAGLWVISQELYERNPGYTGKPFPEGRTVPLPELEPVEVPWLDPMEVPPLAPEVPFDDPPVRRTNMPANPWRVPDEQPQRGPQPKRRVPWWVPHPLEFETPWPNPGRPSEVGLDPRVEQLPDTVELTGTGDPVLVPPRTGFPSPPPKHERQVKVAIYAKGQVLVAFNAVTEGKDFIVGIWKAIPKEKRLYQKLYRPAYIRTKEEFPPIPYMLHDIYENIDNIDWSKALDNLIENQIEDYVFGKIGQKSAEASRASGGTKGWQLGPVF